MHSPDMQPRWGVAPEPQAGETVVVGISGGVDSAVAAWLLLQRGCDVVAVTTKNFCVDDPPFRDQDHSGSCCSEQAIAASHELCAQLGVSHTVLDSTARFGSVVIEDYLSGYAEGRTPSPCVRCNARVRFPGLVHFADQIGARWVATGHYARRVAMDSEVWLRRGADRSKDQSYHLHRVPRGLLARMSFPVGELPKSRVREIAAEARLPVARTPDSQELCFVPDGNRAPLLASRSEPGEIVDALGTVLGQHRGIAFYTPGQRRGLGIAHAEPLYVTEIDAVRNRVVVGVEQDLYRDVLHATNLSLTDFDPDAPGLSMQSRARHPGIGVEEMTRSGELWQLRLEAPDRAPAPGQSVVLYRDDVVVGGGDLVRRVVDQESAS